MKKIHLIVLFFLFGMFSATIISANDVEAREKIDEAIKAESSKKYVDAGDLYMDAELLADDTILKANALVAAANAYRRGERYHKEFKSSMALIKGFRNHSDYAVTVERLYDIGDRYYQGYREPALECLSWTGLEGRNKMVEIYEAALEEAPFAKRAPQSKLRLARIYIEQESEGQTRDKGLEYLREIIRDYPKTIEQKNAYLLLGQSLSKLSMYKDGSETHTQEAQEILRHIILMYPDDPVIPWAKDQLQRLNEDAAKRHLRIADYYASHNNVAGENFELQKLMRDYNGTESAKIAEARLGKIQPSLPAPIAEPIPDSMPLFINSTPFHERRDILVSPEESNGKWLRPIEDYSWDLSRNRADAAKRRAKESALRQKAIERNLLPFLSTDSASTLSNEMEKK